MNINIDLSQREDNFVYHAMELIKDNQEMGLQFDYNVLMELVEEVRSNIIQYDQEYASLVRRINNLEPVASSEDPFLRGF